MKQCVFGLNLFALIVDKWFRTVDVAFRAWPAGLRTVLAKTTLQMMVLQPTLCTYYATVKNLFQSELRPVPATLRQSLLKLTVAGWSLWGATAALQFGLVPARHRTLANSFVGLFLRGVLDHSNTSRERTCLQGMKGSGSLQTEVRVPVCLCCAFS